MLRTNTPSGEKNLGIPQLWGGGSEPDQAGLVQPWTALAEGNPRRLLRRYQPCRPTTLATAASRNPEVPNQGRRKRQFRNQARNGRQAEAGEFILWRADDSCGAWSRVVVGASIQQERANSQLVRPALISGFSLHDDSSRALTLLPY